MGKVTAKLGGGTDITGFTESLASGLSDINRTLQSLEGLVGYTDAECQVERLPSTPEPTNVLVGNLNTFIVEMIGIKLRMRRLDQELTRVFNRLGIVTHREVENANQ